MLYDADHYEPQRTFRPVDIEAGPAAVPSDGNRRAVLVWADRLPDSCRTPTWIADELRNEGRTVPIEQIRGALAGM